MNRREFAGGIAGAVALGLVAACDANGRPLVEDPLADGARRGEPDPEAPRVDGERLLAAFEGLKEFGKTPEGGINRVAFSRADLDARAYVAGLLGDAGMQVSVDFAGNLIGRREGSESLPPLMIGSHIDSVPDGGNFDGQVGSMGAVEVARTLAGRETGLRHPLEVVIFPNEEGGKTGSRALVGQVGSADLDLITASGYSIREGTRRIGGDPDRLAEARRAPGSLAAFFELHVEQGATLNRSGIDVGVVEGIVGIKRWRVTVEGFANHAGTTPMDQRQDALLVAARQIEALNRLIRSQPGTQVGTVGRIEAFPGAPNVIPGRVEYSLEIRDLEQPRIDALFEMVRSEAVEIASQAGAAVAFQEIYVSLAAPTDERLRQVLERASDRLGLSRRRMPSGAGHDAQSLALVAPIGMIFVPSIDGVSHSPLEATAPEDIVNGANVLLGAVIDADREAAS